MVGLEKEMRLVSGRDKVVGPGPLQLFTEPGWRLRMRNHLTANAHRREDGADDFCQRHSHRLSSPATDGIGISPFIIQ